MIKDTLCGVVLGATVALGGCTKNTSELVVAPIEIIKEENDIMTRLVLPFNERVDRALHSYMDGHAARACETLTDLDNEQRLDETSEYVETRASAISLLSICAASNGDLGSLLDQTKRLIDYDLKFGVQTDLTLSSLDVYIELSKHLDPESDVSKYQAIRDKVIGSKHEQVMKEVKAYVGMDAVKELCYTDNANVVMLSAEWCGACDNVRESGDIEDLMTHYGGRAIGFTEMDIDKTVVGSALYGAIQSRGVPTFLVFDGGCDLKYTSHNLPSVDQYIHELLEEIGEKI